MDLPLTIADHLHRAALVYGDRVGVVDEPNQPAPSLGNLSYRRFNQLCAGLAAGLDHLGVKQGARVAIVSHNAARVLVHLFGTSTYGRVAVPINFRLNRAEVAYIVDHCGAEVLVIDPELEQTLGDIAVKHRFIAGEESDALYQTEHEPQPWVANESATASINYTSGTTARPKGVEMTQRNLWVNAATFGWHTGVNDRDVYLHTLPMFHCNGWGMPYVMTAMGVPQIVLRHVDGTEILRRVKEHGVTIMCGAPTVVAAILAAARDWQGQIPGQNKVRIVVAGAPPPTKTIEQVETILGWEFIQLYGLTETAPLLTINRSRGEWDALAPEQRALKLARQGTPALGVSLKVANDGEVLAKGNVVLKSYWNNPDATNEAIREGWFHTGDGGTIDEENYLSLQDRKKDVIISGGENVSSIEVEDCLFSHPEVAEVAVIGVPSDKWGETVKALVVLLPDSHATEGDLINYCRERLAHFKCPTSVELREELARTATGKLQKFKLREPYWRDRERQIN